MELQKLYNHILYLYLHEQFVFTRTVDICCKINSALFYFTFSYKRSTVGLLMNKEGTRGKELWVVLSLLFLLCHHIQHKMVVKWASNWSNKGYDRVPWFFMFLRTPLPSVYQVICGLLGYEHPPPQMGINISFFVLCGQGRDCYFSEDFFQFFCRLSSEGPHVVMK